MHLQSTETLSPVAAYVAKEVVEGSPSYAALVDAGGTGSAEVSASNKSRGVLKRPMLASFDVLMKQDLARHQRHGGPGRGASLRGIGQRARYIQSLHQSTFLPTWKDHQERSYKRNFPAVFSLDFLSEWWLDGEMWIGQYVRHDLVENIAKPYFLVLPLAYLQEGGEEKMVRDLEAGDFGQIAASLECIDRNKGLLRGIRVPVDFSYPPGYAHTLEVRRAQLLAKVNGHTASETSGPAVASGDLPTPAQSSHRSFEGRPPIDAPPAT